MGALSKKKGTNFKEGQVEAKGRDGNDESNKKGTSRAMKMMFQMDGMFLLKICFKLRLFVCLLALNDAVNFRQST